MQYSELIKRVAADTDVSQEKVDHIVKQLTATIIVQARNGLDIKIPNFGTFKKKTYKERMMAVFGSNGLKLVKPRSVLAFRPYVDAKY